MVNIPLGTQDYKRSIAKEPQIQLHNRFFEKNPTLSEQQTALLARPGLKKFIEIGDGPIRGRLYSSAGSFSDAAFVVSGSELYKVNTSGSTVLIGTVGGTTAVSMAATAPVGDIPEFLFVADGEALWVYAAEGFASGTLTATGVISNNETVRIGSVYYKWTSGSVDAGTPAGTAVNPWLLDLAGTIGGNINVLFMAIGATGLAGTNYSTALTAHATVVTSTVTASTLIVRYFEVGTGGNATVLAETGTNIAWGAGFLAGGGSPSFTTVPMPDGGGAISVGYVSSYVIVVPAQNVDINGRFYWIQPAETTIDPLDFATAERSPDPIFQVIVFGDKFLLPGKSTTETWFVTGDLTNPMQRYQGILFDRGTAEGCAVQIKESMMMVDENGAVFQITGGLKRVSTPDIEQRLRNALQSN